MAEHEAATRELLRAVRAATPVSISPTRDFVDRPQTAGAPSVFAAPVSYILGANPAGQGTAPVQAVPLSTESAQDDPTSDSELEKLFRSFDTDGDGMISVGELRDALARAHGTGKAENAAALFAEADTDKDGQLTLEEFKAFFVEGENALFGEAALFGGSDAPANGGDQPEQEALVEELGAASASAALQRARAERGGRSVTQGRNDEAAPPKEKPLRI